jgi:hypothetical protein
MCVANLCRLIVALSSSAFKRQGIADKRQGIADKRQGIADTNCNEAITPGDCGVVGVDPATIVAIVTAVLLPCHIISIKSAAAN